MYVRMTTCAGGAGRGAVPATGGFGRRARWDPGAGHTGGS